MAKYRRWIRSTGYSLLSNWSPGFGPARVILAYHSIGKNNPSSVEVPLFRDQLAWLNEHYRIVSLSRFVSLLSDLSSPERLACITFDDGYRDNYEIAAPILDDQGVRATFFITVYYLRDQGPDIDTQFSTMSLSEVGDLSETGHEIGSHSLSHDSLPSLTLSRVREELKRSRDILQQTLGQTVSWFAYPYGNRNDRVVRLARESGYEGAVTTDEALVASNPDHLQLPRIRVSNQLSLEGFKVKTSPFIHLVNGVKRLI